MGTYPNWNKGELDKWLAPYKSNVGPMQMAKAFEVVLSNVVRQYLGRDYTKDDVGCLMRVRRYNEFDRENIVTPEGVVLGEIRWGVEYDHDFGNARWRVVFTPAK